MAAPITARSSGAALIRTGAGHHGKGACPVHGGPRFRGSCLSCERRRGRLARMRDFDERPVLAAPIVFERLEGR